MPLGGENIGTAYVRIVARGENLDRDVRDMFDDEVFDETGRRNSQAYADAWDEEMHKAPNRERLRSGIRDALAKGDFLETSFFRSRNWTDFRSGLEKQFGTAGKLAGERMERELFRSGVEGLEPMLRGLNARIIDAQKDLLAESESLEKAHSAAILENERRTKAAQEKIERERMQMLRTHAAALLENDRRTAAAQDAIQRLGRMQEAARLEDVRRTERAQRASDAARRKAINELRQDYALLNRESAQLLKGDPNAMGRSDLLGMITRIRTSMSDLNVVDKVWTESLRDTENNLVRVNPKIRQFEHNVDRVADVVGTAFGKGARNNFVNFIGVFASGMARTPLLLSRPIDGLVRFRNEARLSFRQAEQDGSGFVVRSMRTLNAWAKGVDGIVNKVAGSVGGAFLFVGPMLSILSLLTGGVVALAGSLGFALVGAAGAGAGALGTFGLTVGALILGFKNLSKEGNKAASGLKDSFTDLGKSIASGIESGDFEQQMGRLESMVHRLEPVGRQIGRGFSLVLDDFTSRTGRANRAWDLFITAVSDRGDKGLGFLGQQTRTLGTALGDTFGGLLGLFRGLMPSIAKTDNYIADLARNFNEWANSGAGNNEIKNFMDRALHSTESVFGAVNSLRKLLGTLLSEGRRTGDGLFDSLAHTFDDWNAKLQADGGKGLRQWFRDSGDFIRQVGDAIKGIGKLFSALDTEASRSLATHLFQVLAAVLDDIVAILGPFTRFMDGANKATDGLVLSLTAAAFIAPKMLAAFSSDKITGWVAAVSKAETRTKALTSAAKQAAGIAGIALLADSARRGSGALSTLEETAGAAATGFAVAGPWGAAIGGAVGLMHGLIRQTNASQQKVDDLRAAFVKFNNLDVGEKAKADIDRLKDSLDQLTGAYTGATRAAVLEKAQKDGILDVTNRMGISNRTVVSALLGEKGAVQQLAPVYENLRAKINQLQRDKEDIATNPKYQTSDGLTKEGTARALAIEKEQKALELQLATMKKFPGQMRANSREIRSNTVATEDFGNSLKKLPPKVAAKIEAQGIEPTLKGVAKVANQFKLTSKEYNPILKALGFDFTTKQVENMRGRLRDLGAQRPSPLVQVNPGRSFDIIGAIRQGVESLRDKTIYITTVQRRVGAGGQGNGYSPTAVGGIFTSPSRRLVGEAGAEAVVPLNRDLSQVDPAVRYLSAIAQGLTVPTNNPASSGGRSIDVGGIQIITPTEDPAAVANETINLLFAQAYQ